MKIWGILFLIFVLENQNLDCLGQSLLGGGPVQDIGDTVGSVEGSVVVVGGIITENACREFISFLSTEAVIDPGIAPDLADTLCPSITNISDFLSDFCPDGDEITVPNLLPLLTTTPAYEHVLGSGNCTISIVDVSCNRDCLRRRKVAYGGYCILFDDDGGFTCHCEYVTQCQHYQNATCANLCQKYNGYCKVPQIKADCICDRGDGFYIYPTRARPLYDEMDKSGLL
ncbi:hypothetical protein CDAR_68771 [Caerostris darwini]|uniref:Uncharacterized protein n=1 Tax=Caerostris darwini TaxID=1538125 RepID=A0AAV4WY00_9ARAC|nr:hypothetical protein CDAR_68771 [Caerostris darwini]